MSKFKQKSKNSLNKQSNNKYQNVFFNIFISISDLFNYYHCFLIYLKILKLIYKF